LVRSGQRVSAALIGVKRSRQAARHGARDDPLVFARTISPTIVKATKLYY
jgi:hypothetical protein